MAISVLTEPVFFDVSFDVVTAVRAAVPAPCRRKAFIVDVCLLVEGLVSAAFYVLLPCVCFLVWLSYVCVSSHVLCCCSIYFVFFECCGAHGTLH